MTRKFDAAQIPSMPDLHFECALWAAGLQHIAGLDEAGRGAWAGPVAAGVVILPPDPEIAGRLSKVRDSKQMRPDERAYWAAVIKQQALAWGVGLATHQEIDAWGIVPATRQAMLRALDNLSTAPDHLLIDALRLPEIRLPQTPLIKGDARSLSIAAASVLAKTARDAIMTDLDAQFPAYGFAQHKGYGTARHQRALAQSGPCSIHRFSFAPLKKTE